MKDWPTVLLVEIGSEIKVLDEVRYLRQAPVARESSSALDLVVRACNLMGDNEGLLPDFNHR